jgi:thioredoxin-related protein
MVRLSTIFVAVFGVSLVLAGSVRAQESAPAPAPAKQLVQEAQQKAKKQKKAVLVLFHASWCGWCKKLEAVMALPEFKKMFEAHYQIVTLDVQEQGEKKAKLENPGGVEVMKEWGGEKSGLPFYVFLDDKGKRLANSNALPKEQNIGYPAAPEEIEAFMELIKKTAPRWKEADRAKLRAYLVENAPKQNR